MSDSHSGNSAGLRSSPSLARSFNNLTEAFKDTLPTCVSEVEELIGNLDFGEPEPGRLKLAINRAHQIRGSAGSYGYQEIGQAMGILEDQLQMLAANNLWGDPHALQAVRSAITLCKLLTNFSTDPLLSEASPNFFSPNEMSGAVAGEARTVVLLVEDDPYFVQIIRAVLGASKEPTIMLSATTLPEASAILSEIEPDVIILDLNLPDSTGMGTFHAIHGLAPEVPILILTASEDSPLADEAVACGAQDYLIKGRISSEALRRCIRYTMARFRAEQGSLRLQAIEDFVSTLAHDLRVPVQGMKMITGHMLSKESKDQLPEKLKETIGILHLSNNIVLSRLERLLELYEYESKTVVPDLKVCALDTAIYATLEKLVDKTEERNINVHFESTRNHLWCSTDQELLEKALYELLDNSVKFGPVGSKVVINLGQSIDTVFVQISNEGASIPPPQQRNMFKKFWRGTPGVSYVASTGTGLYHCAQIVKVLGGTIGCSSGLGLITFTLRLPGVNDPQSGAESAQLG